MPIVARAGPGRDRIDWKAERDRIDLAAVATRFLGPAAGRRGERGRRLWWRCPFHDDGNPSFVVDPGKPWWKCWGCGEHGDAATLVMKLQGVGFPEAVAILTGNSPRGASVARPAPRPPARHDPAPSRGDLTPEAAAALVEDAARLLWTPEGTAAVEYLVGRGLTRETIEAAQLGWLPEGNRAVPWRAPGIVIPWHDKGRVVLVKIRPDDAWRIAIPADRRKPPKYLEAFRAGPPELYSGPDTIRPGRPLVVVEGEFDALLVGQALGDRAAVVTLGSASAGLDVPILARFLTAPVWYIATDADEAGDKAAAAWERFPRAHRIRPPGAFKDWTEAASGGVNLTRWWSDILNGNPAPPLFTWEELSTWRWGPVLSVGTEAADDYDRIEREAIQADG